jgi:hypothetical protein
VKKSFICWNLKVHSPQLPPILSQTKPAQAIIWCFFKVYFNIILATLPTPPNCNITCIFTVDWVGTSSVFTVGLQQYHGYLNPNVLVTRSGGARLESESGHRLSWLKFFMVFLNHSRQIPGYYLDLVTNPSFQILSNSSFDSQEFSYRKCHKMVPPVKIIRGSIPGQVMWYGERNGTGAGFLLELRFPLPIFILPAAPYLLIITSSTLNSLYI